MSVEMHVLFRGKLPNKKALSQAMAELGFPFTIAAGSLERQRGFMPMRLRRQATGVEFDVFDGRAAVEELAGKDIDSSLERSANFRWSGDDREMLAGVCAAAALAKLVDGIVLEESDGELLSPDQAIAMARQYLQDVRKPEGGPQRKIHDLKHYLKPLLQQRSDLVLRGRLLVIRPVRHIVRGALFEKINGRFPFGIWRFMCPLFNVGGEHTIQRDSLRVWEPHFEPLLMDVLASEIFDSVGQITSIDDFAAELTDRDWKPITRTWAFLLSGPRERAAAYVNHIESRDPNNFQWKPWYKKLRAYVARDPEDLCAEFRADEARGVKELKLERHWEPSPFPIELAAADRKERSDEPTLVPAPWIARPQWLLGAVPERPGEVQFAKDWRERQDKQVLIVPLSREQAEERHRNVEGYVLSARLTNGLLVLLRWDGEDCNHPDRLEQPDRDPASYASYVFLNLYGRHFFVRTLLSIPKDVGGKMLLHDLSVYRHPGWTSVWGWTLYDRKQQEVVYDHRSGDARHSRSVTEDEIARLRFAAPKFGEFEAPVRLMLSQLRSKGYGEIA